jgi:hypothetical protein
MNEILPKLNPIDPEFENNSHEKYRLAGVYEFERKWS